MSRTFSVELGARSMFDGIGGILCSLTATSLLTPSLNLLAIWVSSAASICLLCWLGSAQPKHKNKLMGRQLWHMAVADLAFGVFASMTFAMELLALYKVQLPFGMSNLNGICRSSAWAYSLGIETSALIETHLAVSLAASVYRCPRMLKYLRLGLVLVWPLGGAAAFLEVYDDDIRWFDDHGCKRSNPDFVFISSQVTFVVISLASYIICLVRMCGSSSRAVHDRVLGRVHYYLLAWFICCGPDLIRISSPSNVMQALPGFHCLALVLFNLNGFFNTLVYACHSRYIRRMVKRSARGPITSRPSETFDLRLFCSLPVAFGDVDIVVFDPTAQGSDQPSVPNHGNAHGSCKLTVEECKSLQESVQGLLLGCLDSQVENEAALVKPHAQSCMV